MFTNSSRLPIYQMNVYLCLDLSHIDGEKEISFTEKTEANGLPASCNDHDLPFRYRAPLAENTDTDKVGRIVQREVQHNAATTQAGRIARGKRCFWTEWPYACREATLV